MDRLIDKVLEIIEFEDKWLLDCKSHNEDTRIAFDSMKSKVKAIPSAEPKWIPVIEKLPKEGTLVLCSVTDEKHSVVINQYNAQEYWFDGKIIAWMPLPSPYKGEQE